MSDGSLREQFLHHVAVIDEPDWLTCAVRNSRVWRNPMEMIHGGENVLWANWLPTDKGAAFV